MKRSRESQQRAVKGQMKPASPGCLSEQAVNLEPAWLVFLPLQGQLSFTGLQPKYLSI